MNSQLILTTSISSAAVALVSFITSLAVLAKSRHLSRITATVGSRVEDDMSALSVDLDTTSRKSGEHGRRIAWLEARLRSEAQPKIKLAEEERVVVSPAKPTITERRHRVLSLARRGQDTHSIAQTLGIPDGEVELMISLSRAA